MAERAAHWILAGDWSYSQLVNQVNRQHDRVAVTVHGQPSAVLLAVDDVEALEETIAVLADSDAIRQLTASDAELAPSAVG